MVRHNNMISNNHFHKDWQRHIRQNFNQPFAKRKRSLLRSRKYRRNLPRPAHHLRPFVRCPTIRYNTKLRFGRGFSLQELKSAKINRKYAKCIGISVDHRRRNNSHESLLVNKLRLETYMSRIIIFGKKGKSEKEGRLFEEVRNGLNKLECKKKIIKARVPTEEEKAFPAYATLRLARMKLKRQHKKNKRDKSKLDAFDEKKI